jgi:tRNA (cmo5U34)-methyltransferase
MPQSDQDNQWNEGLSKEFIDYGRFFVPERQNQIEIIVSLLPRIEFSNQVVELCCGEGLLAEAILLRHPEIQVIGYDGSQEMLSQATKRLTRFGARFQPRLFDLADRSWRALEEPLLAVVTSLAVHHLTEPEKVELFSDVFKMLVPGGVFIIADMVEPNHPLSRQLAASSYDAVVREQSIELAGDTRAYDFFKREGWNIFHYLDPDDIDKPSPLYDQLKWLEQVGFRDINVFWMRAGHAIFGGWVPN